jgi:hypothetical protein
VEEEFYYWMNAIMAVVPGMDYPMMAKLLPWCMKQLGYDEWLPVLEAAIEETRIAETEPDSIPEGCSMIYCEVPESMQEVAGQIRLTIFDQNDEAVGFTWPDARAMGILYVVPAGDYQLQLTAPGENKGDTAAWVLSGDNWIYIDQNTDFPEDTLFTFDGDCIYELTTNGLP